MKLRFFKKLGFFNATDLVAVVLGLALVFTCALLLEREIVRYLVVRTVEEQRLTFSASLDRFNAVLLNAEVTAARFGRLISDDGTIPTDEFGDFSVRVMRDRDGLWRSRHDLFDPATEAGIWLPNSAAVSADTRRFFSRAAVLTENFGLGALNDYFIDSWVLPLSNGGIIFAPSWPTFIYDANATTDYRNTPWMQLTAPKHNSKGEVRWTLPIYDPVAGQWLVSIVAPFFRGGVWAGSVGHDLTLTQLFAGLMAMGSPNPEVAQPLYVTSHDGVLWNKAGQQPDLGERIPDRFLPLLRQYSGTQATATPLGDDYLLIGAVPALNARAFYWMDGAGVRATLAAKIRHIQILVSPLILLLAAALLLRQAQVRGRRQQREIALTARSRDLELQVKVHTQSLAQANVQLELLSRQDHLTGLHNRRSFDEGWTQAWKLAQRGQEFLSILLIDVDWFKRYNDGLGHPAGNECLREIARAIAASVRRPGDLAARYGGEEFVLVLPATNLAGALQVAESLRQSILDKGLYHPTSHLGVVSVSIGVATGTPALDESPRTLLTRADMALLNAKKNGRNRVEAAH